MSALCPHYVRTMSVLCPHNISLVRHISFARCCADIVQTYITRDRCPHYILLRFSALIQKKETRSSTALFCPTYGGEGHWLVVGPDQVGPEDDGQVGRGHLVHITSIHHLINWVHRLSESYNISDPPPDRLNESYNINEGYRTNKVGWRIYIYTSINSMYLHCTYVTE